MSFPWLLQPAQLAPIAPATPWSATPGDIWADAEARLAVPLPPAVPRDLSGPLHTSASRIEDFRLCKRKWAFNAIDGVPRPQNQYAEFGDLVHKLRENYLINGVFPPRTTRAGLIALAGLDALPPPRLPLVEQHFSYTLPVGRERVEFRGRIDFLVLNDGRSIVWGRRGVPLVGDHKTTTRDLYVKTPDKLVGGDPQAAIYGAYALARTGAREVDLHWSYMLKESRPRGRQIYTTMSTAQVEDSLARVVADAQQMLTLVRIQGIRASDLEPNTNACEVFGGCPYKSVCPLTDQQRLGAFMNDQNNAQWQPPGANLNQAVAAANNGQQQFAQQGPPQFAPVPNGQPQFLGTPPPQPVQWRMDQLGTPQTQPMQLQQAQQPMQLQQLQPFQQQTQQQALPPGVMRAMDGSLWHTVNGQNVPWQQGAPVGGQQQMPQQQSQQPTPDEIRFAAMLVTQRQNLPANASPGQVAMYSAFIQQPMLAQQYLQAAAAHANTQAQSAPPSQGVVPTDAPPANTQSTTPEPSTGKAPKAAKLPAFKPELVTDIAQSLSRIANALETIVVFAREGNNPPPVETAIQQQPPPVVTQFQQAQPQFQQQQPVQNGAQFQPNGAPNFQPGSGS